MGSQAGSGGLLADLEAACAAAGKGSEAFRASLGVWGLRVEAFGSASPVRPSDLAAAVGFGRSGRNFRPYFRLLEAAGWIDAQGVDQTAAVTLRTPAGTGGWLKVPLGSLAEIARRSVAAHHRRALPLVGTAILLGLHNDHRVHSGLRVDLTAVTDATNVSRLRCRLTGLGVLSSAHAAGDWLEFPAASSAAPVDGAAPHSPPLTPTTSTPPSPPPPEPSPVPAVDFWGADVTPELAAVARLVESYAASAPVRAREEAGVDIELDATELLSDRRFVTEAADALRVLAEVRCAVGEEGLMSVAVEVGKTLDWRIQWASDVPAVLARRLTLYASGAYRRSTSPVPSLVGSFDPANDGVIQL